MQEYPDGAGAESIPSNGEEGGQRGGRGREAGSGNMLELIQLSAACRGSQCRDIVPVCGGSVERVVDTSRGGKGGGKREKVKAGREERW